MSRESGAARSGDRSANEIGAPTAWRFALLGLVEASA
jgi:hypothetical protein